MRNPLNRRFKRELRTHMGRYAAILIIFIVMIAVISGFLVVSNGVEIAYKNDHELNRVEDGQFSAADKISDEVIADIEKLGVTVYQNYYKDTEVLQGQTLRLYKPRPEANIPAVWDGFLPAGSDEIALDRLFAENHGLSVGSEITIAGHMFKISGMISLPDYSSLFIKNTDLMMDSFGFGVGIVTPESFAAFTEEDVIFNYAYRYNSRGLEEEKQADISDGIKESLLKNSVQTTGFLTAKDNQSISFVADDMGSDVPMMKVFLYIILVIMAFVFTVIIVISVESDAAVIGTLFASGYKKGELVRHYLMLPILVTLAGALIGNILSYTAALPLFEGMYYGSYSLPPLVLQFNLEAFLLTTLLPIALELFINTLVLLRKFSLSPLKFLRRDLRRNKQAKAVKLPNLSFLSRFRLRVILQNMGSYMILFFGLLFASFILLFGLCLKPTVEHYIASIEEAAVSEYQYILKMPYSGIIDEDTEAFTTHSLETYSRGADKNLEVSFYGVPENSPYWDVEMNHTDKNAVILSDGLSKKLNVREGETLSFTDPYSQKEYALKVEGIKSYPAGFAAFMEQETMNSLFGFGSGYQNGYVSDKAMNIPEEYIAAVITPKDMAKLGEQMLTTFNSMSAICLFAAMIIYLVLMYILTKVVVDKNAQNISFMKVMGYQNKEVRKLYLTSTVIAVLACLLISLPLTGLGLQVVFVFAFTKIAGYLEAYLPAHLFAAVAIVGFLTYMLINLLHMRRINKIGLAEVLKNRE